MAKRIEIYRSFDNEITSLKREFEEFNRMKEYVYPEEYRKYSDRLNGLLKKYYKATGISIEKVELYDFDYSSTGKTIKDTAIMRFDVKLESISELLRKNLAEIKETSTNVQLKSFEMRKCLKTNVNGCPRKPELKSNQIFVGMPFSDQFYNVYEFGIKIAIEDSLGKKVYRADSNIENKDIMCKICFEMQSSETLIFDISGSNPNVMFELGLSYGLGKETILLKDTNTKTISDLSNVEYIEYRHAKDIQDKLYKYFMER